MKKRLVALILSAIMCTLPVMEVGAAAELSAEEFSSEVMPEEEPVEVSEEVPVEAPIEAPAEEVIVPEETVTTEEDLFTEEPVEAPTEEFADDLFNDGSEVAEDVAEADTAISVSRNQWEAVETAKFKLKKSSTGYYTKADGIVYIQTESTKGYYMFDESGVLLTGNVAVTVGTPGFKLDADAEMYFTDAQAATMLDANSTETAAPWNSDLGQMKKAYWWWNGSEFRYYNNTGKYISVTEQGIAGQIMKINGAYYCLDENGKPATGFKTIASAQYYFDPSGDIPGKMFCGGWKKFDNNGKERWIYYSPEEATIGQRRIHGTIVTQLDIAEKGKYTYLLDKYGYIQLSSMKKAEDGRYYISNSKGRIYKNRLVKYKGARYYVDASGARATWRNCWHRCEGENNRMYYFGKTAGKVVEKKGWQKVTTSSGKFYGWFYFKNSGEHFKNQYTTKGYFKEDGRLASGVTVMNGKTYFFEVSNSKEHRGKMLKSTLISYKGKWYYACSTGVLKKDGWIKIKGNYYFFDNYTAVTNKFKEKDGVWGMLDKTGKFCTGWVVVSSYNNKVRYINPTRAGFYKDCVKKINGLWYRFDKDGFRVNDRTNEYKGPYHIVVDRMNCVATVYNLAKTVPVKTIRVSVGNPREWTPLGTYPLVPAGRWTLLMGPCWGQYGTYLWGAKNNSILFHSVPQYAGTSPSHYALPGEYYNLLGVPASHGCIRCCVADAKFIFDHANGSVVTVIAGTYVADEAFKGPLGRNPLVPLRGAGNFDPTDPECPENNL